MLQFLYMYSKTLKKFETPSKQELQLAQYVWNTYSKVTLRVRILEQKQKRNLSQQLSFTSITNRRLIFCCGSSTILSSKATFLTDLKSSQCLICSTDIFWILDDRLLSSFSEFPVDLTIHSHYFYVHTIQSKTKRGRCYKSLLRDRSRLKKKLSQVT